MGFRLMKVTMMNLNDIFYRYIMKLKPVISCKRTFSIILPRVKNLNRIKQAKKLFLNSSGFILKELIIKNLLSNSRL